MKNEIKHLIGLIKDVAQKNLGWKVFSLLIAICSWFVIINVTNPIEVWTFNAKIALAGVDELTASNKVVVQNQKALEGKTVTAKIRGDRLSLEALYKKRSELIASVNLGVIYDFSLEHDVKAPIDIIIPALPNITSDKFDVVSKNPNYAEITLEGVVTEERSVTVLTVGEPKEGYVAYAQSPSPQTVKITGPKSRLKEVETVVVETSISDKSDDISAAIQPNLLNSELNAVEGVVCDTPFVDVKVSIDKLSKVPVTATFRGEPAPGFVVSGIEWAPKFIEIIGPDEEIDKLKEITLPPVNVTGLDGASSVGYNVENMGILPEQLHVRTGSEGNVSVSVKIEELKEKDISLPVSRIDTRVSSPATVFSINDELVEITVTGTEDKLNIIGANDFSLVLELPALEEGEHLLPVTVNTPEGISLKGEPPLVTVNIVNP